MDSLLTFFDKRAKLIDRGLLGFDRAQVAYHNRTLKRRIGAASLIGQQARAEKSDPFLFNRMMSAIHNGAAQLEDFHVDWFPGKVTNSFGKEVEVLLPRNRKIA